MLHLFGPITIDTTLGADAVVFRSMVAREALGRPFQYVLEVISKRHDLKPKDLVGQPVSVHLQAENYSVRHWNGLVTRLEYLGTTGDWSEYRLVLRPWLWFLTRSSGCRIFQTVSIPQIVTSIFREHGFSDFEDTLSQKSPTLEYVVQYRETDFNFVTRLMEQAGIYYFFKHEAGKHSLVLSDSYGAHELAPGCESLPFYPPDPHRGATIEFVDTWRLAEQVVPGVYSHADYDFERPALKLYSTRSFPKDHNGAGFETYDYPGRFLENADGDALARTRLEQAQAPFGLAVGTTNARGLLVGSLFSLKEHPRDDQNREYLVTSATYELHGHDVATSGSAGDESAFACDFEAMDSKTPFRSQPSAEKPFVRGPQTATVVGKDGEDIWTDEYGRVKIQFHWDRVGKRDQKSSCFVRVSQVWAGDNWGAMHIPRIGQEVIVDFLEGDPDQPIIIGRVYNGQNKPPYTLPANQTQSGIKSRSTKDGTPDNFNEIRFEDKKGAEELFMQAERDHTVNVKHAQSIKVKASRSVSVGGGESISVGGTRGTTVTGKDTQTYKDAREMTVGKTDDETVTGKMTGKYNGGRDVTVTEFDNTTVNGANKNTIVHGQFNITADEHFKVKQGGNQIFVKDQVYVESVGQIQIKNKDCSLDMKDGKIKLKAANELTLECGPASITLKSDGSVTINAPQKVTLKGGMGSVELAAAGATVSGPKVALSGQAMVEIQGALVKIN